MFLAVREMRRAKIRFALLGLAIALLVFLILFQFSLQNALIRQFVGGIRSQSAPVLVFNIDGRRTLQASAITPDLEAAVEQVDGVAATSALWASTFPIDAGGDTEAASVVAYDDPALGGLPELTDGRQPEVPGEVIANRADADLGYRLGDTVTVVGGPALTVVGVAEDVGLNVAPTVFTTSETFLQMLESRNPGITALPPPNALGVQPADGVDAAELAERISAADPNLDALTRSDAADRNPGVASIRQSFNIIFALFALVVPLVTGLFFLIITFQKAPTLTLLRAIGGSARRLVSALLVQVTIVLGAGIAVGVLGYAAISTVRISGLPLKFETSAVIGWVALIAVLGVLSSLVSIRRVLAIDPIEATTGGQGAM